MNRFSQIIRFVTRPGAAERKLKATIANHHSELKKISMKDDYIKYVKIERQIVAVETELRNVAAAKQLKNSLLRNVITYGAQFVFMVALFIISIYHRNTPVIIIGRDKFDFQPFAALMRFPTGIRGAVSVPFWIFVNSFVLKGISTTYNYCFHRTS